MKIYLMRGKFCIKYHDGKVFKLYRGTSMEQVEWVKRGDFYFNYDNEQILKVTDDGLFKTRIRDIEVVDEEEINESFEIYDGPEFKISSSEDIFNRLEGLYTFKGKCVKFDRDEFEACYGLTIGGKVIGQLVSYMYDIIHRGYYDQPEYGTVDIEYSINSGERKVCNTITQCWNEIHEAYALPGLKKDLEQYIGKKIELTVYSISFCEERKYKMIYTDNSFEIINAENILQLADKIKDKDSILKSIELCLN